MKTTPIKTNKHAETILYCALDKPNYRAFILAAKSFLRFYNNVSVVIQDDGSLNDRCYQEIKSHIEGVTIYSKDDMIELIRNNANKNLLDVMPAISEYDSCIPIKIMYLKLLNVIFRFKGKKVILIDSDLLFLRKPNAVIDWIEEPYRRDFYGEGTNDCANRLYKIGFTFKSVDVSNFNSGFIGVYVNTKQDELVEIFDRIQKFDPELFKSWEIEQAIWSIILTARDDQLNLDKLSEIYIGSGWRTFTELRDKAVLVHFVGAIRFKNLRYLRLAHLVIKDLKMGENRAFSNNRDGIVTP